MTVLKRHRSEAKALLEEHENCLDRHTPEDVEDLAWALSGAEARGRDQAAKVCEEMEAGLRRAASLCDGDFVGMRVMGNCARAIRAYMEE